MGLILKRPSLIGNGDIPVSNPPWGIGMFLVSQRGDDMPKQLIAIPYELREAFQRGLTHYKIIFLSAGTGWGKTAAVNKLLEKQNPA